MSIRTPLTDVAAQFRELESEIAGAVMRVLRNGRYVLGEEVEAFEAEVASWLGVRHAIGVASGTDALVLALLAAGVGPGDEVITTPYTYAATAAAIVRVGATPVFADVDPLTLNLDPERVERALGPRTRAVLPVHLFGHPAPLPELGDIASRRGLYLIEDACQAFGARVGPRVAGTVGQAGCFSFFPSKNLGGAGDGGLVVTDDDALARRVRRLRNHGSDGEPYLHHEAGFNSRLDALQAAILRVKLRRVEDWNRRRRVVAGRYRALLSGLPVVLPAERAGYRHVYSVFCIRTPQRDAVRAALRAAGVDAAVHYPIPLHRQPAFAGRCRVAGPMEVAEAASRQALSLPMHPHLADDEVQRVAAVVRRALGCGGPR